MSGYERYNEAELLSLLIQGDEKAFDVIFRSHFDALFNHAFKRLRNKEDSQELVQQIFLSLWENRHKLHHVRPPLRIYLSCAMRYNIIKHYRNSGVRERYAAHYTRVATLADNSTQEEIDFRETQSLVEEAVSSLPERMQEAFRLSREENLSSEFIAQRMNISPRTAENLLMQALKRLRTSLGETMLLVILLNS